MRAVVIHAPKDLRLDERDLPEPSAHEVRVRIGAGGICGSDLHYYHDGGFGLIRVKEPLALGHEIAGTIDKVGHSVSHLVPGMRVAINPGRPCRECTYCQKGLHNHCLDMRFMGSAMRSPHIQGGFCEYVVADSSQAIPISDNLSLGEAAMAEPLAVCLHAVRQAGTLHGKRVLVTGCGPIGALLVLAARHAGALEIVVTDVVDEPLALLRKLGVSRAINVATERDAFLPYTANKGYFDVLLEASGNQAALSSALDVLRPGGIIVQVGIGGDMKLPVNTIVVKELQLRGAFRFDEEFELAVQLLSQGQIDVRPLISATLPFSQAIDAFQMASDRSRAMKVQLAF